MSNVKRFAAAAVSGALGVGVLVSAAGIAGAAPGGMTPYGQLPGVDYSGAVVVTDSDKATVTVDPDSVVTGAVKGTFVNNSDKQMVCSVPGANGEKFNNAVSNTELIGLAFDYYRHNVIIPEGDFKNNTGNATVEAPMGSVYAMFPGGSIGELLDPKGELRRQSDSARVAGQFGTIPVMTVNAGATHDWTGNLSTPTSGERADFDAAALFYCTSDGQAYVFAGDKNGEAPPAPAAAESGSVDLGSALNVVGSLAGLAGGGS